MTVIKLRRPKPAPVKREWGYQKMATNLLDLESKICDLERATTIAYEMTMHDLENENDPKHRRLGLFAVCQAEQLATELREAFYEAAHDKSVRS